MTIYIYGPKIFCLTPPCGTLVIKGPYVYLVSFIYSLLGAKGLNTKLGLHGSKCVTTLHLAQKSIKLIAILSYIYIPTLSFTSTFISYFIILLLLLVLELGGA